MPATPSDASVPAGPFCRILQEDPEGGEAVADLIRQGPLFGLSQAGAEVH